MSIVNTLSRSISASQTSIPLNTSVAIMPQQGGVVSIGSEQVLYTSASEDGLFGCTRGYNSTSAASAVAGASVTLVSATPILLNRQGVVETNLGNPVNAQDAATKTYVDNVTGLSILIQVATDPVSPTIGQMWYNTTSNLVKYYNGTAVKTVTAS